MCEMVRTNTHPRINFNEDAEHSGIRNQIEPQKDKFQSRACAFSAGGPLPERASFGPDKNLLTAKKTRRHGTTCCRQNDAKHELRGQDLRREQAHLRA